MPNIKSAKKRVKVTKVKNRNNTSAKSSLKTTLKKFELALKEGDKTALESAYTQAVKSVDKACAKHLMHKNTASRKKSSLTLALNSVK